MRQLFAVFCACAVLASQFSLGVFAAAASQVVISEIQLAGATADDEFVELYNPTSSAVSLAGFRLTRKTSTGTQSNLVASLTGSIPAHGYFLVGPPGFSGADATYSATMNRIAANNSILLYSDAGVTLVDKVGLGTATDSETAATVSPGAGQSVERFSAAGSHDAAGGNAEDSGNNSADFFLQAAPNPQNTSSPIEPAAAENPDPDSGESSSSSSGSGGSDSSSSGSSSGGSDSSSSSSSSGGSSGAPADLTAPGTVSGLAAEPGVESVSLSWANPADSDLAGILIVRSAAALDTGPSGQYSAGQFLGAGTVVFAGLAASFQATNLPAGQAAVFTLFTFDSSFNYSADVSISTIPLAPDTVRPTWPSPADFTATPGDGFVDLAWPAAADDRALADYFLEISLDGGASFGGGVSVSGTSFTWPSLANGAPVSFRVVARDSAGNASDALLAAATPAGPSPTAAPGEVIISEVAWAGSSVSSSDEWLELFNSSARSFNLAGWQLAGAGSSGSAITIPAGILAPGGYFLVANNAENHAFSAGESVLNISPDFVAAAVSLSNSALQIQLLDSSSNLVDSAGSGGVPPAGSTSSFASMARIPGSAGGLAASWRSSGFAANLDSGPPDLATPKAANFRGVDAAVSAVSVSSAAPLPGETISIQANLENPGSADLAAVSVEFWAGDPAAGGALLGSETVSIPAFGTAAASQSFAPAAGDFQIFARISAAGDEFAGNDSASISIHAANKVVINEFSPDPAGADSVAGAGEWIEFKNLTAAPVDLAGWQINGITIQAGSIGPGEFQLAFAGDAAPTLPGRLAWTGSWQALTSAAGSLHLKNSTSQTIDSASYSAAVEGRSFGRDTPDFLAFRQFIHPTPGAENSETNAGPTAVLAVQQRGTCTPFANFDGSASSDPDGDELSFVWDFGNGQTSTEANPGKISYPDFGSYQIRLIVSDPFGEFNSVQANLNLEKSCASGGAASKFAPEPELPSIPASRVRLVISEFAIAAEQDFIEIVMLDDGAGGSGADISGFYLQDDARIKTIPAGTKLKTGEFLTLHFKSEAADDPAAQQLFSPRPGLTATDDQLTIRDSTGQIADAVAWENRESGWSRGEEAQTLALVAAGAWSSGEPAAALDASRIKSKNQVFARIPGRADSDSAADFYVSRRPTPGAANPEPPAFRGEIDLQLAAVDFKNPTGDSIALACRDCGASADISGWFVKSGTATLFEFPLGTKLKTGEQILIRLKSGPADPPGFAAAFDLQKETGLVATDGQISIKDGEDETEDFVCWTDRAGTAERPQDLAIDQLTQLEKRAREGEWISDSPESCLDSRAIPIGSFAARDLAAPDSDSAQDWQIVAGDEFAQIKVETPTGLQISEILPNPIGPDTGLEWLEFVNTGTEPAQLLGTRLVIGRLSFTFEEAIELAPGEHRALPGLLALRNAGAEIQLFAADGTALDSVSYPELAEGESWARVGQRFRITAAPTPDQPNVAALPFESDRDGDGLADSEEAAAGTDAARFDTDSDGLPDGFELDFGRDPLAASEISAAEFQIYGDSLGRLVASSLSSETGGDAGLWLAGQAMPGGTIQLEIHSTPQFVTVPVGPDGRWQYLLDLELESGGHEVFAQVVDPAGFASPLQKVLDFELPAGFSPAARGQVRISEILPDPAGSDAESEFVELANPTPTPLPIAGLRLQLGTKFFAIPADAAPLQPGEFRAFFRPETKLSLPNSGGEIRLLAASGREISRLAWPKVRENQAFLESGELTMQPTPNAANQVVAWQPKKRTSKAKIVRYRDGDAAGEIRISEILPNPAGSEAAGEFVEIQNIGASPVRLGNWSIRDTAGSAKTFLIPDSVQLQPGAFLLLPRSQTKISLNNTGDGIELRSPAGLRIDLVEFGQLGENISLARDSAGIFRQTRLATPGTANAFDSKEIAGRVLALAADSLQLETESGQVAISIPAEMASLAAALLRPGEAATLFVREAESGLELAGFAELPAGTISAPAQRFPVSDFALLALLLAAIAGTVSASQQIEKLVADQFAKFKKRRRKTAPA